MSNDGWIRKMADGLRKEGGSVASLRTTASSMLSPTGVKVVPQRARSPARQQHREEMQRNAGAKLESVASSNASRHQDSERRLVSQAVSQRVERDWKHDALIRELAEKERQISYEREEIAYLKTQQREYESMPVKTTGLRMGLSQGEKDEILSSIGKQISEHQRTLDRLSASARVIGKPAEIGEIPRANRSASPTKSQLDVSHFGGGGSYRSASPSKAGGGRSASPSKPARFKEGGIVKAKRVGKPSSWISHVKSYQNQHGCSYREAMVKAKATYQK